MQRAIFTMILLVFAAGAYADKRLVNVDSKGIALQGYDPVAYFTQGQPMKGNGGIFAQHYGAVYRFASEKNRQKFLEDPDKYAPQFGGYCAFGVSRDALAPISVDAFEIIDGKLYVQKNRDILKRWQKDPHNNLIKAKANWPGLVEKHGR